MTSSTKIVLISIRVILISIVVIAGFVWSFAPCCWGPVGITFPPNPTREINKIKIRYRLRLINPETYSSHSHPWQQWVPDEFRARLAVLALGLGIGGTLAAYSVARKYRDDKSIQEAPSSLHD